MLSRRAELKTEEKERKVRASQERGGREQGESKELLVYEAAQGPAA